LRLSGPVPSELPEFASKQIPVVLIHDLHEDALAVLDPTRLHDGAQGLRGASLAADHLAAILLRDAQLQHDSVLVFLVLAHLDLVGPVDQRLGEELQQFLQPIPFAFSSLLTALLGWAPCPSQLRTRSSSTSIVEGSVCGL